MIRCFGKVCRPSKETRLTLRALSDRNTTLDGRSRNPAVSEVRGRITAILDLTGEKVFIWSAGLEQLRSDVTLFLHPCFA